MADKEYSGSEPLSFGKYVMHQWNAFRNKDPIYTDINRKSDTRMSNYIPGMISFINPDSRRLSPGTDKTLASAIYNRIAVDCSAARFHHVKCDENGTFREEMKTGLNHVLSVEANIDQTSGAFFEDFVISILDEGVAAAVPVDVNVDPNFSNAYDVLSLRVGRIVGWHPDRVDLEVYNDRLGRRERITQMKSAVAIVENPFHLVMNEPNSLLKRLVRKMSIMDSIDDDIGKKKLDVLIQLPYSLRNETKMEQAEKRRVQLEGQLESSKLGVGYIDSTEKVIQLNRPLDNNLMSQVEYLTSMLYSQLGITVEIMNGTATEAVMMNYYKRTIDPILNAIKDEFSRKFITKTGRTQHQAILFYRDPFSLTPTSAIADIADKFTRNEILSPNEVRGIVGFMPSKDEAADELRNRNINQAAETSPDSFASVGEGGDVQEGMPADELADSPDLEKTIPVEELFA